MPILIKQTARTYQIRFGLYLYLLGLFFFIWYATLFDHLKLLDQVSFSHQVSVLQLTHEALSYMQTSLSLDYFLNKCYIEKKFQAYHVWSNMKLWFNWEKVDHVTKNKKVCNPVIKTNFFYTFCFLFFYQAMNEAVLLQVKRISFHFPGF